MSEAFVATTAQSLSVMLILCVATTLMTLLVSGLCENHLKVAQF